MKKILISIILLSTIIGFELKAQYDYNNYLYTYNQTPTVVGNLIASDWNAWERWIIKVNTQNAYNNIEYVSEATKSFNCHYKAWFNSEQYPSVLFWLNSPDNNWFDYSFVSTSSEEYPGKVTYSYSDGELSHSAITTSSPGRYISKWGNGCAWEHDYDECPYWDQGAQVLKYYTRFTVTGPATMACNSGTFLVPNTSGQNYTIGWSTNNKLNITSQNSYSSVVSTLNSGEGVVTASIYKNGYSPTHYQDRSVIVSTSAPGTPQYISADGEWCANSDMTFFVNDIPGTVYNWESTGSISLFGGGEYLISGHLYDVGYFTVGVTLENGCGVSDFKNEQFYTMECYDGLINLSPNPANDNLKIEIAQEPSTDAFIEIYNVQLVKLQSAALKSKEQTIDISKLPKGIYYLTLKNFNKVYTRKFIKTIH